MEAEAGSGTRAWFPTLADVHQLVEATEVSFEMTQILTGHGFHKEYLHRFHITADVLCPSDGRATQSLEPDAMLAHWSDPL